MIMNELEKIKYLLGSPDETNRELGIVLAISQGMSIEELADKCYNQKWFYIENNDELDYMRGRMYDYVLSHYKLFGYKHHSDLFDRDSNDLITYDCSYEQSFIKMIILFLQDNYPELIKNKL